MLERLRRSGAIAPGQKKAARCYVAAVSPNQPKTPNRTIRIPDEVWFAALAKADERGEVLSEVIRDMLEKYARRS